VSAKNGPRKRRTRAPKYKFPLLLVGLAVLGVAAIIIYATASQQGSEKVDRFMHLHGLAVPAWAPDDVYVGSHQGLARIDSEGEWSFVSEVPHDFMGFQANPTEENVFYSSGHPAPGSNLPNPVGFMVSRDAGKTWEIVSLAGQVDFHVMAVQSTDGDVIYGYSGGLLRSRDAGRSWERVAGNIGRIGGVFSLAVHPHDADTVVAGSRSGLWRSRDAGRTWERLIADTPVTAVTYAGDSLFAYSVSPEAGLMSSDDDGESWRSTGFSVEGDDAIAYIAPHPEDADTLHVGSFGQDIFKTTDGGESWQQLASDGVPENHGEEHE
jgi:photosystem II stability/assembly factor-like uncharacterized protein